METKDYITLTISALAFTLSVISTVIALSRQKGQMRTTIRDHLASVVQDLITALAENSVFQSEPMANRDNLFYLKGSSFSQKLSLLTRQASALIELEPKIAFDVEFSAVAQAFDVADDRLQADHHYRQAIEASPNDYYKVINKRVYANCLFRHGRHQQGRKLFQEALEIFDNTGDFNNAINGFTYQMWFVSEASNIPAPHGQAEDCYRKAQGSFAAVNNASYQAILLQSLEIDRAKWAASTAQPNA